MRPLDLLNIAMTTTLAYGRIFSVHAVCEGKIVSFGASITKQEEWLDEDLTGKQIWSGLGK
ncbi:MAG: hypothetical protein IPJ48_05470 [Propionivibrio sp.]|uniref:Uncharacterized protein n=1 Tax=Candidatus Propionivibrio dominans TaxID=2954373 RepID=A0A9D7F5Q3_9RHOO|nr:hypothetical protein [Propionivibrio sp.]MBK7422575.1 hypothetical protein [Candidatus Propionivibrio dominans]MBK8893072.1 hypothetical protein [Propionivibrio sp.]MBL0165681.1 hypothetical protein [Propionivibrio sp.]